MFPSDAKSANIQTILPPANYANNVVASNGTWVDTRGMVGTLLFVQQAGVAGANLTGSLVTSANSNGAGNAAMAFDDGSNTFTATAGNATEAKTVDVNASKGYVKYVVACAGAINLGVVMLGRPKQSA